MYDKCLFDKYDTADEVFKKILFTRRRSDTEKTKRSRSMNLYIKINKKIKQHRKKNTTNTRFDWITEC